VKLAVSNIAWTDEVHSAALTVLSRHEVQGVEVAPTRLWPGWEKMSVTDAERIKLSYSAAGFEIPAMQSLLFGMPQLNVFGPEPRSSDLLSHLERLFPVARALGVSSLVFGSPRNRDRTGLTDDQTHALAVSFFRRAAAAAAREGVTLCVEPNPPQYGANFITGWKEAFELVDAVDAPGFGLHLDTACITMNEDSPAEAIRACRGAICHFHISEPHLADFSAVRVDHGSAAQALVETGYAGWVSIEMRSSEEPVQALDEALSFVRATYFNYRNPM
jgi:D-psicose/D-tagatose/L-ribulose 3-epimerase